MCSPIAANQDAVYHYQQALALRPNASEIHYDLGDALVRRGNADEAAAIIYALSASSPISRGAVGLTIAFARNGHLENAIEACNVRSP